MHEALELLGWDRDKKKLVVRFTKDRRELDLSPLFRNHFALRGIAVTPRIEDGGIRIGSVTISGPTAYHMGMPTDYK